MVPTFKRSSIYLEHNLWLGTSCPKTLFVVANFPSSTQSIFVSEILSGHHYLTLFYWHRYSPCADICQLGRSWTKLYRTGVWPEFRFKYVNKVTVSHCLMEAGDHRQCICIVSAAKQNIAWKVSCLSQGQLPRSRPRTKFEAKAYADCTQFGLKSRGHYPPERSIPYISPSSDAYGDPYISEYRLVCGSVS